MQLTPNEERLLRIFQHWQMELARRRAEDLPQVTRPAV
jgi:hypothetical protein